MPNIAVLEQAKILRKKGWTQQRIADEIGMSQGGVGKLLAGTKSCQTYSNIYYIYIICESNSWRKIGISRNPEARIKHLQIGNPRCLILEFFVPLPNNKTQTQAQKVEKDCHNQIKLQGYSFALGGNEWFHIPLQECLIIVNNTVSNWYKNY